MLCPSTFQVGTAHSEYVRDCEGRVSFPAGRPSAVWICMGNGSKLYCAEFDLYVTLCMNPLLVVSRVGSSLV